MAVQQNTIETANCLLPLLDNYNDSHSLELKNILSDYLKNPNSDLRNNIINMKTASKEPVYKLYSLDVNSYLHSLIYP